jgi:hypothetical protein
VHVLTTIRWHRRTCDGVLARYDALEDVPIGVEAVRVAGMDETMYWLPEPRALVPGDRLIGDGAGGVRMCPESWFARCGTTDDLRASLQPLRKLPVELVLVSHGKPVLAEGAAALERALA